MIDRETRRTFRNRMLQTQRNGEEEIGQRCLELKREILMEKKRIHEECLNQLQLRIISGNLVSSFTKKMDFVKDAMEESIDYGS